MPRRPREKSSTGIYHVMLRGINRQVIFEDDEDYKRFIQTIGDYKEVCGYELYAYCLMSNHIHLLIKEVEEDLGNVFRRIGASYVYWYNLKYKRIGHLFQDRYKSEANEENNDKCLENEEKVKIDDAEAVQIIMKIAGVEDLRRIKAFKKEKRDKIIRELKNRGLSIRQIERLTEVSSGVVRRI